MARARSIKPGFFRNADLVEMTMEARLLFIGLWTLADRSGRLEDRPKQIKMEVFPADSVDCDALLNKLAETGMVLRYAVNGCRYLQVVNFCKHQNPHRDEKASILPDQHGHVAETLAAPNKHGANTVQALCKKDVSTVAIGLTPDSLITDSPIPDSLIKERRQIKSFAQINADITRSTVPINPLVEATRLRLEAEGSIPKNGPSGEVLERIQAVLKHKANA